MDAGRSPLRCVASFENTKWLAAHTIEAPVKEYRVYTVDTEGHFIKTIKLDCPDDASATESARQFIDGLDIELCSLIARSRHSSTSRSRAASVGGAFLKSVVQ
jgi:hypothetical protein